jgi:protein-S-isoprenylcysteine O-methyltransferase Ste14
MHGGDYWISAFAVMRLFAAGTLRALNLARFAGAGYEPAPQACRKTARSWCPPTPLLLGSWWGLAISPLFLVLFAIRAGIEERALIAGLPGYADYSALVRYRLLPGLW